MASQTFSARITEHAHTRRTPILYFRRYGEEEQSVTYEELLAQARGFSEHLRQANVAKGEVVLLFLPQGIESISAFIGAILHGAIPSFMPSQTDRQDPELFWGTHEKLFRKIRPGAILTQPDSAPRVSRMLSDTEIKILTNEQIAGTNSAPQPPVEATPDDVLLLQHSSGTTGLKKGVMLSHRAVLTQLDLYAKSLELSDEDCIVSWLPLYHDMGLVACLLLSLSQGTPLVLLDPFEWVLAPMALMESIQDHSGTLVWLPNFAFNHLARTKSGEVHDLSSVRAFINCSEPCRASSFDLFLETFRDWGVKAEQLQVCYAMAEMVYAATQTPLHKGPHYLEVDTDALTEGRVAIRSDGSTTRLVSNGTPLPTVKILIADSSGKPAPPLAVGEIYLKSDFMFSGYYKLEESRFTDDGWYRTRDMGFLHHGELYVLGRLDDLIIICGKNVYAHSIETTVSGVDGVHPGRVVAFGIEDEKMATRQLVIIAETKLPESEYRNLRERINDQIVASFDLTPHTVKVVGPNWVVKTTSGKVSREANLKKFLQVVNV